MSKYTQDILLYTRDLPLGANIRVECPACGGGTSGEKSLSITHCEDGTVKWQCFREKCDLTNGSSSLQYRRQQGENIAIKPKAAFDGHTIALRDKELQWIEEHWGITDPPYWYYTPEMGGRIAMSIRSPKFVHRGWVLRDISGTAHTKAYTFLDAGEHACCWFKEHPHAGTIIVEDIPSAVRASKYMNAVAICGIGVGVDRALEIAHYATRPIYMALDNDATRMSFRIARKFALLWDTVKVLPLAKDIKNCTEDELWDLFAPIVEK